jgi:hypothetical protein
MKRNTESNTYKHQLELDRGSDGEEVNRNRRIKALRGGDEIVDDNPNVRTESDADADADADPDAPPQLYAELPKTENPFLGMTNFDFGDSDEDDDDNAIVEQSL